MTEESAQPVAPADLDDLDPYRPPTASPAHVDQDLWALARRGRRWVTLLIAPWILVQVLNVLGVILGNHRPSSGLVQAAMTALLCWFLYRGSDTARFLFTALLALCIAGMFVILFTVPNLDPPRFLVLAILLAFLVGELVILWWPRSVRAFFERGGPL